MKKLFIFFTVLLISVSCFANEDLRFNIWNGGTITADGSDMVLNGYVLGASSQETATFDLGKVKPVGFASLQVRVSGSGTLRIFHKSSNDGLEYATVDGGTDIDTALTAGSAFYQFDMPFARYFKLFLLETGGANTVTIENAVLNVQ